MRLIVVVVLLAFKWMVISADEPEKYRLKTVVIDPGHGGRDPGAQGSKSNEKDIVLAVGLKLGQYIEENFDDVKVIYTRTTDEFIPLHERAEIANKNHADLFISLHANADPNGKAIGTETFAMGLHKNESNLEVAKLENSVIYLEDNYETAYQGFDPNKVESYIVFEMLQEIYLEQSLNFASHVQKQFKERARRVDRGVKQAGFLVLWQTSMPSVLVEMGYITHSREEDYLNSTQGQEYIASAIYRAFKEYKKTIESKSNYEIEVDTINQPRVYSREFNKIGSDSAFFHVQISASSSPVEPTNPIFFNYTDIIELQSNNMYKYAVGKFTDYKQARQHLKTVQYQFPDAFLIATKNKKLIPVKDAIKINNQN